MDFDNRQTGESRKLKQREKVKKGGQMETVEVVGGKQGESNTPTRRRQRGDSGKLKRWEKVETGGQMEAVELVGVNNASQTPPHVGKHNTNRRHPHLMINLGAAPRLMRLAIAGAGDGGGSGGD